MQIPALVRRFTLIYIRCLFACDLSVFHILWLWQNGLFDYKYCFNTSQVNANQFCLQWCTVTWPNDARPTVTRSSFDNDERHVTAFPPISDNIQWSQLVASCPNMCRLQNSLPGFEFSSFVLWNPLPPKCEQYCNKTIIRLISKNVKSLF